MNPDDPPWGVLAAAAICLLTFALMAVVQAVALLGYAVRRGVPFTPQAIAEFGTKDLGALFVEIASIIPAHLLTLAVAWAVVTRLGKFPFFETLGWRPDASLTFWRCAGLSVLLLVAGWGIVQLTGNPETALDRLIASSRAAAWSSAPGAGDFCGTRRSRYGLRTMMKDCMPLKKRWTRKHGRSLPVRARMAVRTKLSRSMVAMTP